MRLLPFLLGIFLWSDLYAAGVGVGAGAGARTPTAKPKKKKREYTPYSQLPFEGKVMRHASVLRGLKESPEFQKRRETLKPHREDEEKEFKYLQTEAHIKHVLDGIRGATYEEAPAEGETDVAHMKRFMRNLHTFSTKSGIDSRTIPTMDTETAHMITHFDSEGIPQTIQRVFEEMVANELKHKNRYVFYHGTCNRIGFLMEILTELRSLLSLSPKTDVRTLRAFEKAFDKIRKAEEFIRYHERKAGGRINDHDEEFKAQGISTNVFLFGNYEFAGECTFLYWISARSISPPPIEPILQELFGSLGVSSDKMADATNKLMALERKYELQKRGGLLLQILAAPEVADEVGYISWAYGVPLKVGENVLYPSRLMPMVRNDPQAGEKFLKDNVSLDRGYGGTTDYLSAIQARYFLKPDYMQDSSKIMTFSRWRHPLSTEKEKAYKEDLERLIRQIVEKMVKEESQPSMGSLGTQGAGAKESPLLTLAHLMKSGGAHAHLIVDEVTEANLVRVLKSPFAEENAAKVKVFFDTHDSIDAAVPGMYERPLDLVLGEGNLEWSMFLLKNGANLGGRQGELLNLVTIHKAWNVLTELIDNHTFTDFSYYHSVEGLMISLAEDRKVALAKQLISLSHNNSDALNGYLVKGIAQRKDWALLKQLIDDGTFTDFSRYSVPESFIQGLCVDGKIALAKRIINLSSGNELKKKLLEWTVQNKQWALLKYAVQKGFSFDFGEEKLAAYTHAVQSDPELLAAFEESYGYNVQIDQGHYAVDVLVDLKKWDMVKSYLGHTDIKKVINYGRLLHHIAEADDASLLSLYVARFGHSNSGVVIVGGKRFYMSPLAFFMKMNRYNLCRLSLEAGGKFFVRKHNADYGERDRSVQLANTITKQWVDAAHTAGQEDLLLLFYTKQPWSFDYKAYNIIWSKHDPEIEEIFVTQVFSKNDIALSKRLILSFNSTSVLTAIQEPFYQVMKGALKAHDTTFLDGYAALFSKEGLRTIDQYTPVKFHDSIPLFVEKENIPLLRYLIDKNPKIGSDRTVMPFFLERAFDDYKWYMDKVIAGEIAFDMTPKALNQSLLPFFTNNKLQEFTLAVRAAGALGGDLLMVAQKVIQKDALDFLKVLASVDGFDMKKGDVPLSRDGYGRGRTGNFLDWALQNKAKACAMFLMNAPYALRSTRGTIDDHASALLRGGYRERPPMDHDALTYAVALKQGLFDLLPPMAEAGVTLTPKAREILAHSGNAKAIDLSMGTEEKAEEATFMGALKSNNDALVKQILDKGVKATDQSLKWLINGGQLEAATHLIETYPKTHTPSALVLCCKKGKLPLVQLLIQKGVDVNAQADGSFPLLAALGYSTSIELVQTLLRGGARDHDDQALHAATGKGFEIFKACYDVLATGAYDINRQNAQGRSLIFPVMALDNSKKQTIDFVLSKNPKVDLIDKKGNTVLHVLQDVQYLDHLVAGGADINHVNNDGKTPLDLVYSLYYSLHYGAFSHVLRDKMLDDQQAFSVKEYKKHSDVIAAFKAKGAVIHQDQNRVKEWYYALFKDDKAEAERVLGLVPSFLNNHDEFPTYRAHYHHRSGRYTSLEMATVLGSPKVVDFLIEKGASLGLHQEAQNPFVAAIILRENHILRALCKAYKAQLLGQYDTSLLKHMFIIAQDIKGKGLPGYTYTHGTHHVATPNLDSIKIILTETLDQNVVKLMYQYYSTKPSFLQVMAESATPAVHMPPGYGSSWSRASSSYNYITYEPQKTGDFLTVLRTFALKGGKLNWRKSDQHYSLLTMFTKNHTDGAWKARRLMIDLALNHGVDIGFKQPTSGDAYVSPELIPLVEDEVLRQKIAESNVPKKPENVEVLSTANVNGTPSVLLMKNDKGSWGLPGGKVGYSYQDDITFKSASQHFQQATGKEVDEKTLADSAYHDFTVLSGLERDIYKVRTFFVSEEVAIPEDKKRKLAWVPLHDLEDALQAQHETVLVAGHQGHAKSYFLQRSLFVTLQQPEIIAKLETLKGGGVLATDDRTKSYTIRVEPLPMNIERINSVSDLGEELRKDSMIFVAENVSFKETGTRRHRLGTLSLLDSGFAEMVKKWQKTGKVFGLTSRNYHGRRDKLVATLKEKVALDYKASLAEGDPTYFKIKDSRRMLAFVDGMLFQAHDHDGYGAIMKGFLEKWVANGGKMPDRLFVVDKNEAHVMNLAKAFKDAEIPVTIFWVGNWQF